MRDALAEETKVGKSQIVFSMPLPCPKLSKAATPPKKKSLKNQYQSKQAPENLGKAPDKFNAF